MGNLKEIRTRIASISSTQKITSAMKLVSAAKLRKAQTAILNIRPYASKLNHILGNFIDSLQADGIPLFAQRDPEKVVLVVITSNRGLCGNFNSIIIKETCRIIEEKYQKQHEQGNLKLICIGKKGYEQLSRKYDVIAYEEEILNTSSFSDLSIITNSLMDDFIAERVDKVEVIYNRFVNPATQYVTDRQFLPIVNMEEKSETMCDFIFDPSKEEFLENLIPKILRIQMYQMLADSIASEHGARMTSMSKATDNAMEMLKELKLKYNNARQAAITNELIEIISGSNALDN